jgi:hypothetical protein
MDRKEYMLDRVTFKKVDVDHANGTSGEKQYLHHAINVCRKHMDPILSAIFKFLERDDKSVNTYEATIDGSFVAMKEDNGTFHVTFSDFPNAANAENDMPVCVWFFSSKLPKSMNIVCSVVDTREDWVWDAISFLDIYHVDKLDFTPLKTIHMSFLDPESRSYSEPDFISETLKNNMVYLKDKGIVLPSVKIYVNGKDTTTEHSEPTTSS